jgi:hypothetical protein
MFRVIDSLNVVMMSFNFLLTLFDLDNQKHYRKTVSWAYFVKFFVNKVFVLDSYIFVYLVWTVHDSFIYYFLDFSFFFSNLTLI